MHRIAQTLGTQKMVSTKLLKIMLAASVAFFAAMEAASATPMVFASVGGAPTGVILDNLNALALGSAGGITATGIQVSFVPDGGVVQGSLDGIYAPPFLSGGNGTGFGSPNQTNGADGTVYITAGGTATSSATLTFASQLHYFGLLWGSIDTFNTLELLSGTTVVGTITGSDAALAASTLPSGMQSVDGTAYVNINSDVAFDGVRALSTQHGFEFDNVAYSMDRVRVPEPLTISLFVTGLAGAAAIRRRKKKQA